jgi:hypothetical protein
MRSRNRSDTTKELWRCSASCGTAGNWSTVLNTTEANGITNAKTGNTDISMLVVTITVVQFPKGVDKYVYVGFDNETNGAEVFRCEKSGSSFTAFARQGDAGLGPEGTGYATARAFNKHIVSNAQVFYDGKAYVYINAGCLHDTTDNGPCDRNPTTGDTSIRVFRQKN